MLIELSLSGKTFVFSLSQLADNLSFNMIHMCGGWCWLSDGLVVPHGLGWVSSPSDPCSKSRERQA